jgi:lipopolysaccharide transport system permease protein
VTATEWEITAQRATVAGSAVDVWRHRALLRFVGSRARRKIYRRTVLGWLWLFINPLFPIALRAVVFGGLIGVSSAGLPYFLFLIAGSVVWDVFAASLTWGTRSLEMNRDLVDYMYVPRVLLPFGNTAPALLDLALKIGVLLVAVAGYAVVDGRIYVRGGTPLLWAAGAVLLAFALSVAVSFFTSVWGETTRDMRFTLGQVMAVWYLLTPVLYPLSEVPEAYRDWMLFNPMAIVVETFKWGLFGIGELRPVAFGVTVGAVALLTMVGLTYFAQTDARAADER